MSRAVLLVEDNHDNRMIYGVMLEHAGYTVIEAVDGEQGLERARWDEELLIRGHAAWALGRIGTPGARAVLEARTEVVGDRSVQEEFEQALEEASSTPTRDDCPASALRLREGARVPNSRYVAAS